MPGIDAIASRTLELRRDDGSTSPVVVRVGRPRRVDDRECRCDYEIDGLSQTRRFYASGEDEVQALWLALVMVGVDLLTSAEGKAGHLSLWDGPDLGFPSIDQLRQPEWHPFDVDGEAFHWRAYPLWQRADDGEWTRCQNLEVAREPNALGAGGSFPVGTAVGVDQARDLVRRIRESGKPLL